ncbi:MAG TPA: YfhO family protein, partial [Pyrinomonadaceae bacterium]
RVEIAAEEVSGAPNLLLSVLRLSLIDSATNTTHPLQPKSSVTRSSEPTPQPVANDRWQRLADIEGVTIYENRRVLPRAWLAVESRALDAQQLLEVIRSGKFADGAVWDPLRTALVESPVPVAGAGVADGLKADVIRNDSNRVEVETVSTAPTVLVLSANHYPGWRAYVDGQSVETLRVNYNLRGVVLSAGNHEVSFVYSPKSVLIGVLISLFAASGLTFWYFRLWAQVARLLHRRGERI